MVGAYPDKRQTQPGEQRQDQSWLNVIPVAINISGLIDDNNSMFRRQPNKLPHKTKANVMQEYVDMSLKQQTNKLKVQMGHHRKLSHVITKPKPLSKHSTVMTGLTPNRFTDDSSITTLKKTGLKGQSYNISSTKQLLHN